MATVYGQVIRASVKAAKSNGKTPNYKGSNANVNKNSETVSTHVQDSNAGPLNSIAAEVMSSPRGKVPLHSGYTHQCCPRSEASINNNALTAKVILHHERPVCANTAQISHKKQTSVNSGLDKVTPRCENINQTELIFDVNYSGIEDKFVNSILHARHAICWCVTF